MLGGLFAVLSAVAFSLNAVLVRQGVSRATPIQAAFATVLIGVPLFAATALVTGQLFRVSELPVSSYALLAVGGIVNFLAGRHFNYRAIEALGSARAAPFQAVSLPYSIFIAFLFLDEGITVVMAIGVALIIAGPAIMVERRESETHTSDAALEGGQYGVRERLRQRQLEGYVYAVLAALAYGTSPILIRGALEDEAGLAVLGGLVAHATAAGFLLALAGTPAGRGIRQTLQPAVLTVFLTAAFSVFIAQLLRFLALALAPIAIATALERTQIAFTLVLAYLMNRTLELITLRVALGVLASMSGALILAATLAT